MEWLLRNYIDKGMPVVFWACIDMREPVTGPEWKLLDGGGVFTWISNEHCMLLVGYDADGYYFNDPYEGHGVIHYPKALVENRHRAQYEMAVGVIKKNEKTSFSWSCERFLKERFFFLVKVFTLPAASVRSFLQSPARC